MSKLDFQPSFRESFHKSDLIKSLYADEIDPKHLYATERLAGLWRQVFLKHSPIHHDPEFARIYRDAFRYAADSLAAEKIWLIGLGAGTGLKEAELIALLQQRGCKLTFSAIDVSADLVLEASEAASESGADLGNSLVGDLADTEFLERWLHGFAMATPRLFTFFGLVPNMPPSTVARLFRAVLRSGDVLLCSAHLAPVSADTDLPTAMRKVLPQYDNAETLEWLTVALEEWGLTAWVEGPSVTVGEREGTPALLGVTKWKWTEEIEVAGMRFVPQLDKPLRLFQSLRYTPELFEDFLRKEGFRAERLAMTACREEAIWAIRG